MTIASTTSKVSYNGSGSNGPFPITYKFTKNADLTATKRSSAGVETVLALTTDYTLTGAGDAAGGSLTLTVALAVGESLVIARAPGIVQEVDYVENSAFPAETHEGALDLLTMVCQSLQEQIDRSVKVEISSTTNPDDLLAGLASDVAAAAASASQANTARIAAELAETNAEAAAASVPTFGAFGLTLAGTTTASNARSALGLGSAALANTGTSVGNVPVLDAGGKLVSSIIPSSVGGVDQAARDNAAMNAFIAHIQVGRVTGPMPKGGIWLFATDEMTKGGGAVYEAANKRYSNQSATVVGNGATLRASQLSAGYTTIDLNFALPTGLIKSARFYTTSAGISCKVKVFRLISGTQYSFVGESQAVTSVNGVNTIEFATPFAVQAGDRLALYSAGILANAYTAAGTAVLLAGDITSTQTFGGQAITLGIDATVITGTTSMTLTTPAGIALGSAPTKATLYLLHKALDALTYNTDIIVKASRGADYAAAPDLAALCQYDTDYTLLRATVDLSALASGSTGLWCIETTNKGQQVRAALAWFE
jgi:hypothetical protein